MLTKLFDSRKNASKYFSQEYFSQEHVSQEYFSQAYFQDSEPVIELAPQPANSFHFMASVKYRRSGAGCPL